MTRISLQKKFYVLAVLFVLLIGVNAAFFMYLQDSTEELREKERATNEIVEGITSINALTSEYVIRPSGRVKTQWRSRYADLLETVVLARDEIYQVPSDKVLVGTIASDLERLEYFFNEMVELQDQRIGNGEGVVDPLEEVWSERLFIQSSHVIFEARELLKTSERRFTSNREAITAGALVVGFALFAVTLVTALVLYRDILYPVRHLQFAVDQLSKGSYNISFPEPLLKSEGEFGDLSRSFADMALKLKEIDRVKSEFIGIASHELRTPLSVMKLNLEILEYADPPLEEIRARVSDIHAAVDHMVTLVNTLLDAAIIDMGQLHIHFKSVRINQVIDRELAQIAAFAKNKDISIEKKYEDEELPPVWSDGRLLGIVFMNILSNAVKYNKPGGSIVIDAEIAGPSLRIHVMDTGVGIARDVQSRIFEKGFRASEQTNIISGMGVGLYTVKYMVDKLKGRIWVQSEEGEGAAFTVELPIQTSQS